MIAALCALALWTSPEPVIGRYDMGLRLVRMDRIWVKADRARKAEAVPHLNNVVTSFFAGKWPAACRALDEATAALQGRSVEPTDAVSYRAERPIAETGEALSLIAYLAYDPGVEEVRVRLDGAPMTLKFGEVARTSVTREPSLRSPVAMVQAARWTDAIEFSRERDIRARLERMASSGDSVAGPIGEKLLDLLDHPDRAEVSSPFVAWIGLAERRLSSPESRTPEVFLARQGSTLFRATLHPMWKDEATVVVALHGAGGSEEMFYRAYGAGAAASEAWRRKWAFFSPRTGTTAVADVLDWLRKETGVAPKRLFVMGHSLGGGVALRSGSVTPKPSGVALFAPAAFGLPENLAGVPLFLAVGTQEMPMLRQGADKLAKDVPGIEFKRYDPCEHLMVVAEGIADAYAFFDRVAKKTGH
ncbi:MAG: alpha/beta fold hydrolase [Fimbriimonadaceae bacterium]|nr:alpha/beta fold hydrolase [Fimbriimonadaceae bacterium]